MAVECSTSHRKASRDLYKVLLYLMRPTPARRSGSWAPFHGNSDLESRYSK